MCGLSNIKKVGNDNVNEKEQCEPLEFEVEKNQKRNILSFLTAQASSNGDDMQY